MPFLSTENLFEHRHAERKKVYKRVIFGVNSAAGLGVI